jgi:hypothetical protein
MPDLDDPRVFPDPAAATAEAARLHRLAMESLAAATGRDAEASDAELAPLLDALLAPGQGARLAEVFASAPSVAVYRHLWRRLAQREGASGAAGTLRLTPFALPIVVVAGIEAAGPAHATLSCALDDPAALAGILRDHGALAGNRSFAFANALVAARALDLPRLPDLLAWHRAPQQTRALEPDPIALAGGTETVHLRFLVGSALAAPGADILHDTAVGKWGMPLAQALGRQLAQPGTSVLALPRAPQSLLQALREGRAAQREVGLQVFAANAIRKLRASVGEPTAVISAHHARGADYGGELRLSLSSPFDPREAEGFCCPLEPLENVDEVVAMLAQFLGECRVSDVRVVPGVHGDRDPDTGLLLLFKGDAAEAQHSALH